MTTEIKNKLETLALIGGIKETSKASEYLLPREKFRDAARELKNAGFRLVAEWASDETSFVKGFAVYAAYNNRGKDFLIVKAEVPHYDPVFPSITKKFVSAYRFERQIHSLMGLIPEGHPDLRPWIKHEDWPAEAFPLRKKFDPKTILKKVPGAYPWIRAEGEGVFEIPVGPVHAGIIEPGHFRFQAVGEDIINLEEKLGYVHKGVEKRFESLGWNPGAKLAGRVSGDSTVAHTIAYCRALEAASNCNVPERALWLRAIMLERERIANHLGDVGAICNDTAFTFILYQMSILREKMLRTNMEFFGHRLMMDGVVPGGVAKDFTREASVAIFFELQEILKEFDRLVEVYENSPSLEDRVYGAGVLSPSLAREIGVVGFVARSSGQALDARVQDTFTPYDRFTPNTNLLSSGDVHARAWVRIEEVRDSVRLITTMLNELPEGNISVECPAPKPGATGFSTAEGWRGEVVYWVQAGPNSEVNRCMVRDPSSINWLALEQAILGNIVPDFPLCNKSFNQSYSGNDL